MTNSRDDVLAWLGPAGPDATDEQVDQLMAAADDIDARWPDQDDREVREAALSAAAQVILGDATLEAIAGAWHQARQIERDRMAALTGALLVSHTGVRSGPGSESDLIARTGAARATVRKALGKNP